MRDTLHPLLRHLSALLLLACTGVSGTTMAGDYTVELVVYANLLRDSGVEQWPVPRAFPDTERAFILGANGTRLLEGPRNLQAIADTLRRSNNHRLLLHWYWQQPGWAPGQGQAMLVQIPAASTLPVITVPETLSKLAMQDLRDTLRATPPLQPAQPLPLLDGTVSLLAGDILQVDVDLIYRETNTGQPLQLRESRRLRGGELHYLDHPRFGVLLRVEPVAAAAP